MILDETDRELSMKRIFKIPSSNLTSPLFQSHLRFSGKTYLEIYLAPITAAWIHSGKYLLLSRSCFDTNLTINML
jgi:hypothetical protein